MSMQINMVYLYSLSLFPNVKFIVFFYSQTMRSYKTNKREMKIKTASSFKIF